METRENRQVFLQNAQVTFYCVFYLIEKYKKLTLNALNNLMNGIKYCDLSKYVMYTLKFILNN